MTPQEFLACGDIDSAIWSVERSEAAGLVSSALRQGVITFDALRPHLLTLWQSTDYPCRRLPPATWLEWFRRAGLRMPLLPSRPIRAWRAQVGDAPGLSWTYDREVAERFHGVNVSRAYDAARLLEAIIPAHASVAHLPDPEHELIVDPSALQYVLSACCYSLAMSSTRLRSA